MLATAIKSRRHIRRSIRWFSDSLGPTPAAVASSLESWGVRGTPRDSNGCAVARCMGAIIGADPSVATVSVTVRSVHVTHSGCRLPMIVRLPKPVSLFIRAFDTGSYPDLIIDSGPSPSLPGLRLPASDDISEQQS